MLKATGHAGAGRMRGPVIWLLLVAAGWQAFGPAPRVPAITGLQAAAHQPSTAPTRWVDADRRPTVAARQGLNLLARAHVYGLDPAHYGADQLAGLAAFLDDGARNDDGLARAFDHLLHTELLRYLEHVSTGRIDPRAIGHRFAPRTPVSDLDAQLRAAAARGAVDELAAALQPARVEYWPLVLALEQYRRLAADPDLAVVPPLSGPIHPGDTAAGLAAIHHLLDALGDMPGESRAPPDGAPYDELLKAGIKRFQLRHGLEPDGVIGRATQAALRVPLAWRVRQIELALERLRWSPDAHDSRSLVVNIPMFELAAWERGASAGPPAIAMRVIVGKPATPTPVITGWMRTVILRPYWNVPTSVLRGEILPLIARDPDYLRTHEMEIVRGQGDDARPLAASPKAIADLRHGLLRLRQRPGPHNALGLVKFHFENEENVYLHGTPVQQLFGRATRAFSHGCMRVEAPMRLAEWVLEDAGGWTEERLVASTVAGPPREAALVHPVHIAIVYLTAAASPDGVVRFADDLYGHDAVLDQALHRFAATAGAAAERTGERPLMSAS